MSNDNEYDFNNELINDFKQIILNKFSHFCQVEGKGTNFYLFLDYLINHNIIKNKTVAKYMVMELYPESLFENKNKSNAINDISLRTGISSRHVYNMIQHPERYNNIIKKKAINKKRI